MGLRFWARNTEAPPNIKVSAIVPVRNDNNGGNLRLRASLVLQAQAASFDEVVLVDFNTKPFLPPLLATLNLPDWALAKIRSLVISPQRCAALLGHPCTWFF